MFVEYVKFEIVFVLVTASCSILIKPFVAPVAPVGPVGPAPNAFTEMATNSTMSPAFAAVDRVTDVPVVAV